MTFKIAFLTFAFSFSAFSFTGNFFNASGEWKAQLADENQNKPCETTFTVTQTETSLSITERVYKCNDRYTITRAPIEVDIKPGNETVLKLVDKSGKGMGVIFAAQIQILVNHEQGEALYLDRGGKPNQLKIREMVNLGNTTTVLNGVGTLVTDLNP